MLIPTEIRSKRDKGFTLVELLIVIVILGVVATLTVFAVRGITDKGAKSACDADKATLEVAAESYFALYGSTANIAHTVAIPAAAPAPAYPAVAMPTGAAWTAGAGATAEQSLVNAGLLRGLSTKFEVNPAGGLAYQDVACGTVGNAA